MRRVMAVYDVDPFYADRFAEVVNQKESVPFTVMAFSTMERLKEYARQNAVELLLVSESASCEDAEEVGAGQVIVLAGGEGGELNETYPSIYKFQSSYDIIREVMACYCASPADGTENMVTTKKTIIGVYSPVSRCLKTSFALTMGQLMAQEQKVLYVNLEEYAGFHALFGEEYQGDLSDLMYYYRQGNYNSLRLSAVVYSTGSLDYIPPARYPEDFGQMDAKDMAELLQQIMEGSSYEVLIVDAGQYGRQVLPILEICTVVYQPVKEDVISLAKVEAFEAYLDVAGKGEIKEKIRKVKLPDPANVRKQERYVDQLLWGELGDYVRQMIGGMVKMPV